MQDKDKKIFISIKFKTLEKESVILKIEFTYKNALKNKITFYRTDATVQIILLRYVSFLDKVLSMGTPNVGTHCLS